MEIAQQEMQPFEHRYKHWNGRCMCNWIETFWSVLALVIILLPAIILKLAMLGQNSTVISAQRLYLSPALNAATIIISFALSIYSMSKAHRWNYSARTIALLALIVCVLKLVLLQ